jgi:hypothetical protein
VYRTWLGIYHGALVTILRISFCNLCSISMFDWDAVPHNRMPYVQMGFNMIMYISSLLVRESSNFLPVIQYIRCSISPSCLRLLWICDFHVSRRSMCIPRYLTVFFSWGMLFPLSCTAGHSSFRRVKVMYVNLDSFARMRHTFSQCSS